MTKKNLLKLVLSSSLLVTAGLTAGIVTPIVTNSNAQYSKTSEFTDSSVENSKSDSVKAEDLVSQSNPNDSEKTLNPVQENSPTVDEVVEPKVEPKRLGEDESKWILTVPQNLEYKEKITYKEISNSQQLNSYLLEKLGPREFTLDSIEHLSFHFINGTADYEKGTFQVAVIPEMGWSWTNGTNGAVLAEMSLPNLIKQKKDAEYASAGDYLPNVIDIYQIWNNKTMDDFLSKNFKVSNLYAKDKYKNVSVEYVKNSANYDTENFKVKITPLEGHLFANGSSNPVETVVGMKLNKDFVNYHSLYYGWLGNIKPNTFTTLPYVVIDNNSNDFVTYRVFKWQFAPGVVSNLASWSYHWNVSTDGGKTWSYAGQGETVTVNKKLLPASGLWLQYVIATEETTVDVYGPTVFPVKVIYQSNPIKVLD
ncbi:MAG: hypothetical protein K2H56_00570 [Malacoplasma sp.]|nr:hypothetical protein [Malacoplasma sp.]MDE7099906.1 hypothetical protein [Malacoplasma sp.]